jgi:hypothetical protein
VLVHVWTVMPMMVMGMLVRANRVGAVRIGMIGRRRAALAIDPAGVTVLVVLFLPDRYAVFDLIDDVSACEERLVPMPGAHTDPDGHLADGQITDSMYARGMLDSEARDRVRDDALAFFDGERLERLVLEMSDAETFVVVAYPTLERGVPAARRIGELSAQRCFVNGFAAEAERCHAPDLRFPAARLNRPPRAE